MHKALEELRETLSGELEEISRKGELSAGDLETVHKLTDTIKNIDKICILAEDGEYLQAGDWEARGYYGRGGSYDRGDSYARRRDSMGRYTRADGRMGMGGMSMRRGGRYSRGDGMEIKEELEELMDKASTEREREAIRMAIKKIDD